MIEPAAAPRRRRKALFYSPIILTTALHHTADTIAAAAKRVTPPLPSRPFRQRCRLALAATPPIANKSWTRATWEGHHESGDANTSASLTPT
jgi:hypothetical protein